MRLDSVQLAWLAELLCALTTITLVALTWSAAQARSVRTHAAAYCERLERDLRYLQLGTRGARLARGQALLALALSALALLLATPWPSLGAGLCLVGPRAALTHLRRQRSDRVAAQIDTGLVAIANALQAGGSLGEALASAARVLASPLSDELTLCLRENALGVPLDDALGNLTERVQRPTVTAALVTLQVARNTGGDVIDTLQTSAANLRELTRLEGVVQSKTAEARAQAWVIAIIPVPLVTLLDALDPSFLAPVWNTASGHLVVMVATVLWAAAVLVAREIMDVDV
jgi:tight adherence protein B